MLHLNITVRYDQNKKLMPVPSILLSLQNFNVKSFYLSLEKVEFNAHWHVVYTSTST